MTGHARPLALAIQDTRRWLAGFAHQIPMFTITDHPRDWPDYYVARLHLSLPEPHPTAFAIMDPDLERLRTTMEALGGHQLARSPEDDPVILETWIL